MGDVKPWQIAILVLAAIALAVSAYLSLRAGDDVDLASSVVMVDVTTGELFEYSIRGRRAVMIPGAHPDTGEVVLLPAEQDDEGRWVIRPRARPVLREIESEPAAVDLETGEIRVSGGPRRVR